MNCIACGRETNATAKRGEIEAAFCHYHYPMNRIHITIPSRMILVFVR
ncbi:MAG TPA: hypothetical protein HA230_01480 [Candidatus Aenigmarchaeota archaeon]|nr:hypothetical protein [Candidatus Aenigmarchaeota archaeon]